MTRFEKDSIVVNGRVCPCLNSRKGYEVYQYSNRVILWRRHEDSDCTPRDCTALIYAEQVNTKDSPHRQPALAFGTGRTWEKAIKDLATGLRHMADNLDNEPPRLNEDEISK